MAEALTLEAACEYDRLFLDTCVLIDEFERPSGRLQLIRRPQRATSVVALWEFLKGATLSRERLVAHREWLNEQGIAPVGLSRNCSKSFESLLRTDEAPPSLGDALLAAECLARQRPLVTSNWRDFVGVRGLRYVAW